MFATLTTEQRTKLEQLVFDDNFNPDHEDDYFNAGGFSAHWDDYSIEERTELIEKVTA